jgi:hypothetical protein
MKRLYYSVKPLMPWVVRMAVRRWFAARTLARSTGVWPILPGSEKTSDNWPGWPHAKKFALVLTHDVEGPSGLNRCRELMRLEQQMGFRSSFNFIPEGSYRVPAGLMTELRQAGFEVGLHDLKHDGKLYSSRREFSRKAARINKYLREWCAAGFRSGFMLHNLDWLHELNIQYDASTFDTDPFEPQPEGKNTIFPFWVQRPGAASTGAPAISDPLRSGYVELPYTLPQDSTLFLLLRETTPAIWLRKLDWIATHGGMALLNVHPDYICFEGDPKRSEYPAGNYRHFLEWIQREYSDQYYHCLPRELASYCRRVFCDDSPEHCHGVPSTNSSSCR